MSASFRQMSAADASDAAAITLHAAAMLPPLPPLSIDFRAPPPFTIERFRRHSLILATPPLITLMFIDSTAAAFDAIEFSPAFTTAAAAAG